MAANPFQYFYFFPSTDSLVGNFVVVILMETNNTSAALNTWLAFNIIYPSLSTGKQKNIYIFYCFLIGSNSRSGLHFITIIYLNCDLDQVILSKFQFIHLLKGSSNSDYTGLR